MPTPAIQTLVNDAQQVLNLDSISAVRSVVAVSLANANTGTPLNPNLTTQQLWNEFYQVVTKSKSDIESIIANQLMKFLYSPPAPGGVGADKQVIFNDGGVLAGDPGLTFDKVTNALTITGNLTVDTNTLFVDATNNRVGCGTATPTAGMVLDIVSATSNNFVRFTDGVNATGYLGIRAASGAAYLHGNNNVVSLSCSTSNTTPTEQLRITNPGVFEFLDGAGGTRMTLDSTGLGVGGSPVTSHLISSHGPIGISGTAGGTRTSYIANSGACSVYYTDGGGSGYFTDFGNLIIQPRTSAPRSVVIATGSTTPVERAIVKSTGQVRFVPLAADPSGAEAGDVYYNSTSNKLKCYNGTTWNDLF